MSKNKKAEIILPTPLADKVPVKGGLPVKEAIRRAEDVVTKVAGEFEQELTREFAELDTLMAHYTETSSDETLDQIFRRIHNLRGQGTTLGYPLITRIGTSFCRYLIERNPEKPILPALIDQHLKALHIVLRQKQAGAGDEVSLQVSAALEQAVSKEIS